MSMTIGEKVRSIRDYEGLSRPDFCEVVGINKETLVTTENGRNEPKVGLIEAICKAYPQYVLWLMTGEVYSDLQQVSPLNPENIGSKILHVREAENLSTSDFSDKVNLDLATLTQVETGKVKVSSEIPQAVCIAFPQYTLWLMTGQTDPNSGQIAPDQSKKSLK